MPTVDEMIRRYHAGEYDFVSKKDAGLLVAEIERLRKWVDDLQAGMYINCVYCGHRYGPDEEVASTMQKALYDHISVCPKHPLSQANAEVKRLKEDLAELLRLGEDIGHIRHKAVEECWETLLAISIPKPGFGVSTDYCNGYEEGLRAADIKLRRKMQDVEEETDEPLPPTDQEWLQGKIDFLLSGFDDLLHGEIISAGRYRELTGLSIDEQRKRWRDKEKRSAARALEEADG